MKPTASIWSPAFATLLCMSFLMAMGQMTAGTVLPLYMRDLGAATSMVGFVSGAFAVTAILIRPFAGPAFDSFSKKRLLMIAMALICVAMASYAVSRSVPAVIAGRLVHGLGMGCTGPLGMAMASETPPRERMSSGIGLYFTVYAACLLVTRPLFGRLADRLGTTALVVPGCLCFATSFVLLSQAQELPGFLLAAVVGACGFGVVTPLLQSEVFRRVGEERRGSAANTSYLGMDLGQPLGPWLGGRAVEGFEAAGTPEVDACAHPWLVMLLPIAAGLAVYLTVGRRKPRR